MQQYQRVACIVCVALLFLPVPAISVPLPEGLRNMLRVHNVNMYAAPCPANDMILQDIRGGAVSLAALRGKVVILNFWKIDCPPCLSEKPVLDRISKRYGHRGLEIIAVNLFDDFNRVRTFAQKSRFGFTICGNHEGRFSTRKQPLPGGTPTTFVVNDRSEAIYEVPAVPTTYLIDRTGNVVGNSVGMVNWEEEPLGRLLECMLGPGEPNVGHSQVFSDAAGKGYSPAPNVHPTGPTQHGATDSPQNSSDTEEQTSVALRSEVQGKNHKDPDSEKAFAVEEPVSRQSPAGRPESAIGSRRADSPSQPTRVDPPRRLAQLQHQYGTPRPYTPPSSAPVTQRAQKPYVPHSGPAATPPATYPSGPTAATSPETGQSGSVGHQPPLPIALPYTPPRLTANPAVVPRQVAPDSNGTVMARIQPYGSPGATERQELLGRGPVPGPPLTSPTASGNILQELILDSFDGSAAPDRPQPLVRPVEPIRPRDATDAQPEQPANSILGQVGRDFQNLGSGVGDLFSRIWPGKQ